LAKVIVKNKLPRFLMVHCVIFQVALSVSNIIHSCSTQIGHMKDDRIACVKHTWHYTKRWSYKNFMVSNE